MAKITTDIQIRSEDYQDDDQQLIDQLGQTLNPFIQEVAQLFDERIGFDNTDQELRSVEFTVDSNGVPVLNDKIVTGKQQVRGTQVISAFNLTNNTVYPTSQPFISYRVLSGGVIQVLNITGLPAGNRFRMNIVIY